MKTSTIIKGIMEVIEGLNTIVTELEASEGTSAKVEKEATGKGSKKVKEVEDQPEDAGNAEGREAELEAMSYNDIKALVSKLGGKAVGNKTKLVELILELEAKAPVAGEDTGKDDDDNSDDADEQEYIDFLTDLEKEDLLAIGKKLEIAKPKTFKKDAYITLLVADLDALYTALEELGYYDENNGDEKDSGKEDDNSDDGDSLADKLDEKSLEELAEICEENGLSKKGKKQALIDRIVKAVEAGDVVLDGADDNGDDNGEWYSQEELEGMSEEELKDIADTNDLEIPMIKKGKKKVMDKEALIEAIIELGDNGEGSDDPEHGSDSKDDFEASEERLEAEAKVEKDIRAKYKAKKLKDSVIEKFLKNYYEGNPEYKKLSKEDALETYIELQKALVDDDGEKFEIEDCYIRNEEYFCCGKQLADNADAEPFCEICGTEYNTNEE